MSTLSLVQYPNSSFQSLRRWSLIDRLLISAVSLKSAMQAEIIACHTFFFFTQPRRSVLPLNLSIGTAALPSFKEIFGRPPDSSRIDRSLEQLATPSSKMTLNVWRTMLRRDYFLCRKFLPVANFPFGIKGHSRLRCKISVVRSHRT